MMVKGDDLAQMALALKAERKRQSLSREDLAAAFGVSTSFIRDAEATPENGTLGKLARLIHGLGLGLELSGLASGCAGPVASARGVAQADFGVPGPHLAIEPLAKARPT